MKHNSIRRIALGLAVAAVVPATAQARPMDISGNDVRAIHQTAVSAVAVSPDDRAFSRQTSRSTVAVADNGSGVGVGTGSLGGLVLILAAGGAALAIHQSKKAKLSPA
jgi:uncharacterized membrane protein